MKTKNKKIFFSLLAVFLGTGIFLLAAPANADASSPAKVIGGLLGFIIGGLGVILSLIMKALVMVAQYSDFIHAPAVTNGWKIVRDLCNMFFVLILLVIAFATILHQEKYDYKKWLPKLIMMAILINFSKTICGLMIDFAQVIMLTFVNAFKGMAAGNLVKALGLADIMTLAKESDKIGFFEIVTAYLLGLIYVIIALVVVVTMLAMLVMRIVMMWIYIVLSPLAYLLGAFPDGKSYSEKWWKQFTENLIVGPVLAFFIWLSFASLQSDKFDQFKDKDGLAGGAGDIQAGSDMGVNIGTATVVSPGETPFAASKTSTPNSFISFVIAIGMLVGGLKIAQEVGGAAADIAGKGFQKIKNGATAVGNATNKFAKNQAKIAGKRAGSMTLGATGKIAQGLGNKIQNKFPNNKITSGVGSAMASMGGIGLAWREDVRGGLHKDKEKKRQDFMEKIGMGEKAMNKTDEFSKSDTGKNETNLRKGVLGGAAAGLMMAGPVGAFFGALTGAIGAGVIDLGKRVTTKDSKAESDKADTDETLAKEELRKADLITSSDDYEDGKKNLKGNKEKSESLNDEISDISQSYNEEIRDLNKKRDTAITDGNITLSASLGADITKKTTEKNQAISKKVAEKNKVDKKIQDFEDLDRTVNAHRTAANGFNDSAKEHREKADELLTTSKWGPFNGKTWSKIQTFASETTQKAAANGSKEIKAARDKVITLGKDKDSAADFDNSAYYSASGQTGSQKKFFNELISPSNESSPEAIANLTAWAKSVDPKNEKQMSKVEALAKGIAAFSKGGGDTSSLNALISEVDKKNTQNKKPVASVSTLKEKVIANRKTGAIGEQGSGDFHVNTFANNDKNEDGKNIIGVDFNKLSGSGLDVKAEASFASGESMAPIINALKKQIEDERNNLKELYNGGNGDISKDDYEKKNKDFDNAQARFNDPNQVKDLQLINTASANYGRQEKMTSKYHEEIHAGGVEDEDLTERTAKSLMDNKLYGRNASTKGRHATEIAKFAQEKKNQGMSNDDIMKEVEKEIQARLQTEGKNRAERVVKIMNGDKETISESMSEEKMGIKEKSQLVSKEQIEVPEINTEKFQESLDALSEKFEKTAASFKNISVGGAGSDKKANSNIIYALKNIKKAITAGNTSALKKMGSLSGGKAPSTIIEASVINDALESNNEEANA